MPSRPAPTAAAPHIAHLTPRQKVVLNELLADGARDETIAKRLGVKTDTIKSHVRRILGATRCQSRTELIVALYRKRVRIAADPEQELRR